MEENKNLVVEEPITENVETPTEETPKTYTEADFNAKVDEKVNEVLGKKIARREAKIRKEYDRKYGELEGVLKAGTGKETVEEMTDTFRGFYQQKGIDIPQRPEYSARDIEVLAKVEADEIIRSEEAVEEFERLEKLGAKMSAREQATFKLLAEHLQNTQKSQELAKIGVSKDVYESQEFKDFASKFNPNIPIADVYSIYEKTQPKKDIQTMGSIKNNTADDKAVKDFYSYEEAMKFTKADFDKNPALFKAVQASMPKWK